MLDKGKTTGSQSQIDAGTWRTTKANQTLELLQVILIRITGGKHNVGNVLLNLLIEIDLTHHLASLFNLLSAHHWTDVQLLLLDVLTDDGLLLFQTRIVNHHLQHETVHLSLRQRISTLLLNGVLSSQHQERLRKFVSLCGDGHLTLLHSFKQSTLHLGRSTVNLISQDEVSEDRTLLSLELTILLRINHCTDDIGRQQVRSELNAAELSINQRCQSLDSLRLSQTRYTLKEYMTI